MRLIWNKKKITVMMVLLFFLHLYGVGFICWYKPLHFDYLDGMTKNILPEPIGISVFAPCTDIEVITPHKKLRNTICFLYKPLVWYFENKNIGYYIDDNDSIERVMRGEYNTEEGERNNDESAGQ
jgi:hypothetical protein